MDEETRRVMEAGFGTLADLIRETNTGLSTNGAELVRLRGELGKVRDEVRATNGRLDNLIAIAGGETRDLRQDVDALKGRVDALEQKAS